MSLVVVALAAGVLVGWIRGGRIRHVAGVRLRSADLRLRSVSLLLGGAACELVASRWGAGAAGSALLIVGYLLLIGFALRNVTVTGMVLVAFGLIANLAVIAVDGGMPVRGVPAGAVYGPRHHGVRPGDHLVGLADWVRLGPGGETVSPGDLLLALGVATVAAGLMRPPRRSARPRRIPASR